MTMQKNTEQIQAKLPWEEDTTEQVRKVQARKRANNLDGKTWLRFSISIWNDIRKTPEEEALGHPAIFPTQLVTRLIKCYTTEEDKVIFDPFVGVGSTVVAAHRLGKTGIGIDIEPKFVEMGLRRLGVVFDVTGTEYWRERPYWQQASWLILEDGRVIPSRRLEANALRIEADLQELSPPPTIVQPGELGEGE